MCKCTGWKGRTCRKTYMPPREHTRRRRPAHIHFLQKSSLARQPNLHSISKLYSAHKNASHFLFTSDLPLSPKKTAKNEKKEKWGGADRGRGREVKERRGKMGGRQAPPPSLSPYLLSLSLSFFSFCLAKGKLDGQSFATSNLQLVHLTHYPSSFFEPSVDKSKQSRRSVRARSALVWPKRFSSAK